MSHFTPDWSQGVREETISKLARHVPGRSIEDAAEDIIRVMEGKEKIIQFNEGTDSSYLVHHAGLAYLVAPHVKHAESGNNAKVRIVSEERGILYTQQGTLEPDASQDVAQIISNKIYETEQAP